MAIYKKKKSCNLTISGLPGGDKRDRTADLLNAIDPMPRVGVEDFSAERKKCCSAMVFRFL